MTTKLLQPRDNKNILQFSEASRLPCFPPRRAAGPDSRQLDQYGRRAAKATCNTDVQRRGGVLYFSSDSKRKVIEMIAE